MGQGRPCFWRAVVAQVGAIRPARWSFASELDRIGSLDMSRVINWSLCWPALPSFGGPTHGDPVIRVAWMIVTTTGGSAFGSAHAERRGKRRRSGWTSIMRAIK